ncbi:uncharacterized protein BYT42DRAFT_619967 [Radiomyces spectabilis]|uniref:uncharacterized protein n=1 Tax=Radiomyces spectabilis TaxID=64574 RepID=UPI00221F023B|nr:uncharacterized protein BYT42DRAFT_541515 [Radiomyces spectabilis]XP_051428316.1 uncharacterized protein BYT42DRAFT_619967 [Radiomyces spectabilis]KAI8364149.1 hypothetical protein BYT42DRAFT_541515 [Radiomyces spectabilis]KAI8393783.1 hypothetical protein BYT42DRAFT_619967 [Radiomyces spectabilis]
MATFLRSSELQHISLTSTKISSGNILTFVVVTPKERRKGHWIIKPFLVHPHHDATLCPVRAFQQLQHYH